MLNIKFRIEHVDKYKIRFTVFQNNVNCGMLVMDTVEYKKFTLVLLQSNVFPGFKFEEEDNRPVIST